MSPNRLWVLLARKYNDELTPEEQEELAQLLRRYQDTYELNESIARLKDIQVKKLTTETDAENSRAAIAALLDLQQQPEPAPKRSSKTWWLLAAAACMVLVAGLVLFTKNHSTPTATPYEVVTSTAKSKVRLPDGSTVVLNRQSRLVYNRDFGVTKREISLSGEAFFDITRNEALPLTVTAGPVKIQVLGTAFNVRAYSKDSIIETSLIRGSIEVSSEDDPDRTIRMRPNEKIVFGKGIAQAAAPKEKSDAEIHRHKQAFLQMNRIEPNPADSTINEIVWVQDRLVFSKEPFYSLALKMERWYQVRFRFKDKVSEQLSLTGSLEKETLTEALDALQQLTPFNYKVDSGVVTISKKINPIR